MIEEIVRRCDGVKEFSNGIWMEKVGPHIQSNLGNKSLLFNGYGKDASFVNGLILLRQFTKSPLFPHLPKGEIVIPLFGKEGRGEIF